MEQENKTKVCPMCKKDTACAEGCGVKCGSCHCKRFIIGAIVRIIIVIAIIIGAFHFGAHVGFMKAGGTEEGWEKLRMEVHGK